MLKQTALIVMLFGLSMSPPAFSQDDEDSDDTEMQADEDEAFDDEADVQDEEETSGDEADVQEEEEEADDTSFDDSDADELSDESGDEFEGSDEDASLDIADSEEEAEDQIEEEGDSEDASGMEAADPVSETPPTPPTAPPVVNNTPPAAPPAASSECRCGRPGSPVGMRIRISDGQCSDRQSGTVKWFSAEKCFGFITPEGGQDLFVHFRSIQGQRRPCLKEGQQVTFKVVQGQKGLMADEVQVN